MTVAFKQKFKDTNINVDGATFEYCTFENCNILFSGLMPPALKGNTFSECTWTFIGPAANTVNFMTAFYDGGGKDLIEATLQSIRSGGKGRRQGDPVVLN